MQIHLLRSGLDWTQESLAKEAGLSVDAIKDIEGMSNDDDYAPRLASIIHITEALGTTAEKLKQEASFKTVS